MDLVKPIANIYSYGFYRNLFHIFPSLIVFFMYFISLLDFLEILKWNQNKKKEKHRNSAGSAFGPRLRLAGVAQRPIRPGRPGHPARAWVRRVRLPPRTRRLGSAPAVGTLVVEAAHRRQMEYRCRASDSSGKVWWTGSHRSGATPERRRMWASMAVFPVSAMVLVVLVDSDGLL
jgi:hypothetical protein